MKRLFYIAALAALTVSCAKQEPGSVWYSTAMRFSANAPATRTIMDASGAAVSVTWSQDDTIGIWSSNSNKGNYPYVAQVGKNDATKAQFAVVNEEKMFLYDGKASTYYAYLPYNPALGDTPEVRFSLPASQKQTAAGDVSHLADYNLFRSDPVSVSGAAAFAEFAFHPALSMVHLALSMDAGETLAIPVRKVSLVASDSDLHADDASLDLKTLGSKPVVTTGGKDVSLQFGTMPVLATDVSADSYLTVLPSSHGAAITAEVTAVDGSVASYQLPAISFEPGRIYSREIKVKEADFVQAEPYGVTVSALNVAAGTPVEFTISGAATSINFWSGEKYHDYAYATVDRIESSPVYMSFLQALLSGGQGDCLDVKLSTNYDGTLTEEAILAATWTDITDDFNLDTTISGSGNPNSSAANYTKFKKTSDVDLSKYAAGKPFRVAMFWHALPDMGGRTVSWITGTKVWDASGELMNQENSKGTNPYIIEGASYGSDTNHCAWYDITFSGHATSNCFRFFSTFTLTGDQQRHAYAVIDNSFQASSINKGHDKPVAVQAEGSETPGSYSYTFDEPGTYNVTFEAALMGLDGSEQKIVKSFTITVS